MPSLSEIVRGVRANALTLHVLDPPDDEFLDSLLERFADRNVEVIGETGGSGGEPRAVLRRSDEPLVTVSNADLNALAGRSTPAPDRLHPVDRLSPHLSTETFASREVEGMIAASREIEDRAFRARSGALHAGFQRPGALSEQSDVYRRLASTDLEIHLYTTSHDDGAITAGDVLGNAENVRVHVDDDRELERHWFVVFDGGNDGDDACALIAEERHPRRYYGIWTYDRGTVARVLDRLVSRYGAPHPYR